MSRLASRKALLFGGQAVPTYVGAAFAAGSNASAGVLVSLPAGTQAKDLCLVRIDYCSGTTTAGQFGVRSSGAPTADFDDTWTNIYHPWMYSSWSMWKRLSAAEVAAGSVYVAGSQNGAQISVLTFRNAADVRLVQEAFANGGDTSIPITGFTKTINAGPLVVFTADRNVATNLSAYPANWTRLNRATTVYFDVETFILTNPALYTNGAALAFGPTTTDYQDFASVFEILPDTGTGSEKSQSLPAMTSLSAPSGYTVVSGGGVSGALSAFAQIAEGSSITTSGPQNGGYVGRSYPSAKRIARYGLKTATELSASVTRWSPEAWLFQGSNDGSTWTTLDTRTSQVSTRPGSIRWYDVPVANQAVAYLYHRLAVTGSFNWGGGANWLLQELILLQV